MNVETLHVQLDRLKEITGRELSVDTGELLEDHHHEWENESTVGMKVGSILGAFVATVCFVAFVFLTGLYESMTAIGVMGLLLLLVGWLLNRRSNVITNVTTGAFSVSLSLCGAVMFLISFVEVVNSETGMALIAGLLALVILALFENKIITFLATIGAAGSLLFLVHDGFYTNGAHAYVALMALLLFAWVNREATLLNSSGYVSRRYDSIRTGLMVALLMGAYYLSDFRWWGNPARSPNWYASLALIPLVGYVGWGLLQRFVVDPAEKGLYAAGILALLLPTFFAPALSAALLLLLLSWKVGYQTGTALAVIALIYFVSRYYYDLNLTLLTKSIVMMVSGIFFLIAFVLLRKKLSPQ